MFAQRQKAIALGIAASLTTPLLMAQDPARLLLEQGQYWQSQGNSERATEAWQKLLRMNPGQPEAFYGLARAELDAKRPDEAVRYLEQLRRAQPGHALIARLEQEIALARNSAQLQAARQQARSGQPAQAVDSYQAALGGKPPTGPLALEYYQTLGSTPGGWDEARRGLEGLAQESPGDAKIALALAQHLTYRESTRRQGIAQLSKLSDNADVGKAATESWRKALAWTGSRTSDAPLYQAYLRAHPDDTAVQARLREIETQQRQARTVRTATTDPLRMVTNEGFKALDDGDLEAAEASFYSVLQARPSDNDALGGMGVLRLRQEEFAKARDYLERASRGGSAARWKQALESATYWTLVEQAESAREANDSAGARALLEQAVRLNPREVTAENSLADVLVETGNYDLAEAAYRRVLVRQQDNPDAIRGLVGVLAQNNKAAEALQLVEKLSPSQQEKVGALGRLRATQAMGQAKAAAERGDVNGARLALEDALLNDPANPWVRLDLARLYLQMGAGSEARGVVDGLLVSNPLMPEALYASALLSSEAQDWRNALATLERIPEAYRTRDIASLQKRVWVHVQAEGASALAAQGQQAQAMAMLAQAEPFVGQDTELLGTMALAYADAGDPGRALGMVRQVLARTPRPDVGLQLQYAATLLKTNQDVELAGMLRQLQNAPMSAAERRSYDDVRRAYIVRQADALREAGNLAAAYDVLVPVLAERPGDPAATGALARMYAANNNYPEALALYNQLLEREPNNVQILLPAATMATAAKEYELAESALQIALLRAPQDPQVLTAAGRLARARGKTKQAGDYFAAAIAAEDRQRAAQMAASRPAGAPSASRNPFAQRGAGTPLSSWDQGGSRGLSAAPVPTAASYLPAAPTQQQPYQAQMQAQPMQALYVPNVAGAARFPVAPQNPAYGGGGPASPAAYYTAPANSTAAPAAPAAASTRSAPAARTPATSGASGAAPVRSSARANAGTPANSFNSSPGPSPSPNNNNSGRLPAPNPGAVSSPGASYVPMPATAAPSQAWNSAMAPAAGGGFAAANAYAPAPVYAPVPNALPQAPAASSSPWNMAGYPALTDSSTPGPRTVRNELQELRQAQAPVLSVGTVARVRQGESGLGQVTDLQAPVQFSFGLGDGTLTLGATPTAVSAGTPDQEYGNLSRFGSGPVTALNAPTRSPGAQDDSGIGLHVAYTNAGLEADVGTRPLGFGQTDVTGGVKYSLPISDSVTLAGQLSRRAVNDSVLSFAGARDARTRESWGGVSATGGRLDATWDDGDFGIYGYGALHGITGTGVQNNSRYEAGGGMYWRVQRARDSGFTAGLNFSGLGYDKNLRYFTYGHGGYFSPQQFLSLSVPIDWTQRTGRLSYQLKGSLGVQYFKEDAAPYFPTSATRQAAAAQAASDAEAFGTSGSASALYRGQSKTGLGYSLGMAMEYQMHPQLFFGGHLMLDNARDYRQFTGGLYMRYALEPHTGSQAMPVKPLLSPYSD